MASRARNVAFVNATLSTSDAVKPFLALDVAWNQVLHQKPPFCHFVHTCRNAINVVVLAKPFANLVQLKDSGLLVSPCASSKASPQPGTIVFTIGWRTWCLYSSFPDPIWEVQVGRTEARLHWWFARVRPQAQSHASSTHQSSPWMKQCKKAASMLPTLQNTNLASYTHTWKTTSCLNATHILGVWGSQRHPGQSQSRRQPLQQPCSFCCRWKKSPHLVVRLGPSNNSHPPEQDRCFPRSWWCWSLWWLWSLLDQGIAKSYHVVARDWPWSPTSVEGQTN